MNPPAISVIVPLYNCKPVIAGAIASLRAQTFRDFECLLIDDCSPDREGILLCERLIAGDPRFRLLHNPKNLGLGGHVTRALRMRVGIGWHSWIKTIVISRMRFG